MSAGTEAVRAALRAELDRRIAMVPHMVKRGLPFDEALREAVFDWADTCLLRPRVLCLIEGRGPGLSLRVGVQLTDAVATGRVPPAPKKRRRNPWRRKV